MDTQGRSTTLCHEDDLQALLHDDLPVCAMYLKVCLVQVQLCSSRGLVLKLCKQHAMKLSQRRVGCGSGVTHLNLELLACCTQPQPPVPRFQVSLRSVCDIRNGLAWGMGH